ncbi:MAG: DUF1206 domain-containing protein [Brevundimonas sp.]|nr:MAG: DUF1206 domain-containing protein [Brevundimonas sp.]
MRRALLPQGRSGAISSFGGWARVSRLRDILRTGLHRLTPARRRRQTVVLNTLELIARIGYGARGFVYLSGGVLTLLAIPGLVDGAAGTRGAIGWLAKQPLGRAWVLLLGLGLLAIVVWRMLQAIWDADNEGHDRQGISTRISQGFSGIGYGLLALSAFSLLFHTPVDPAAADIATGHREAQRMLSLPFGNLLLAGIGLCIAGVGIGNIVKAWRDDFAAYLSCSVELCRRVVPLARAGYMARGVAWLPLAALIFMAGIRSRASDVTSFDAALDTLGRQPGGALLLAAAALGFIGFGLFSFIEARFRHIRPPREIVPV